MKIKPVILHVIFLASLGVRGFACTSSASFRVTPLAETPDWSRLVAFQETITRDDFLYLLDQVFSPDGAYKKYIVLEKDHAWIVTKSANPDERIRLNFAPGSESEKPKPRYWRTHREWSSNQAASEKQKRPLEGLKIALDPGHLGGPYARMEERYFQVGSYPPVKEGDLTLKVAKILQKKLRALGADVILLRENAEPLTSLRPEGLKPLAESLVKKESGPLPAQLEPMIRAESERLFYRTAEIRERARRINEEIRPDLVVALHFNAENWEDPDDPKLVDQNHLHLIVNGAYLPEELAYDNVRLEMLVKLLNGSHREELALAETMSAALAEGTGLQPCFYPAAAVKKIGRSPYIWARHLLANRLYQAPVLYLEPYVMNHPEVFSRIQAGEYEGRRRVDGELRVSLFEEYAEAVTQGLKRFSYSENGNKGL